MNIFEFAESKGWKVFPNGRWYREEMAPQANTFTFKQVIEDLIDDAEAGIR